MALTILGPILTFGQMGSAWEQAESVFTQFPALKTAIVFENYGSGIIVIYGILVGATIWGGDPNGRRLAKLYLKVRLIGFIIVEFLTCLLMKDLPSPILSAGVGGMITAFIREIFYFLIWWSYFKKSIRVKNTYGPE